MFPMEPCNNGHHDFNPKGIASFSVAATTEQLRWVGKQNEINAERVASIH
jgi:hypothetical protein